MLRRRGLVSQSTAKPITVSIKKRTLDGSDSDSDSSLSDSSSPSSSSSAKKPQIEPVESTSAQESLTGQSIESSVVPEASKSDDKQGKGNGKGKPKRDYSDETKWKKIRVEGSDKEVMVDVSRIQKYVDYDAAGVDSYKKEIESAKGNFRQQAMADYSDL